MLLLTILVIGLFVASLAPSLLADEIRQTLRDTDVRLRFSF